MKPKFIQDLEKQVAGKPVKTYSQTGEEGVILALCSLIGIDKGTFIDFGAGDGSQSNVRLLAEMGWKGIGYDGGDFDSCLVWLKSRVWVTKDNAFRAADSMDADIDFFSLDLDGNDYWILKELLEKKFTPVIICAEINGCLPAYPAKTIAYNPDHRYMGDDYYGMSFGAFCDLVEANGYIVVWNQHQLNCFAVRADLLPKEFADYRDKYTGRPYRPEFTRHQYHRASQRTDQNWVTV